MEQGFLFDGIDVPRAGFCIDERIESAAFIFSDSAYPPLTFAYPAMMSAEVTMYVTVVAFLVEGGFFHDAPSFPAGAACCAAAR